MEEPLLKKYLCINPTSTTGEVKILTPNPNQPAIHLHLINKAIILYQPSTIFY